MTYLELIYAFLVFFNYICVAVSLYICYYFVRTLWRSHLVHPNLKTILCLYSTLTTSIGCCRTIIEVLHYLNVESEFLCISLSFVNAFCTGFLQLSLLAIFLERWCATYNASSYELGKRSCITTVGLTVMFCWATTFASGAVLYDHFIVAKTVYPVWPDMCLTLSRRPFALITGWLVYAAVTMPSLPPCFYLAWYNIRLLSRKGVGTLSTRYQYKENAQMLRSISISLLILNIVFGGLGLLAVMYMCYGFKQRWPVQIDTLIAIKITNITIDVGCELHYLMVLAFHPLLGKQVRRFCQCTQFWRRKTSISSVLPPIPRKVIAKHDTEIYFKDLQDTWNR